MILSRLYELAVREGLLDALAFEVKSVPFVITVGEGGEYLGLEDRRTLEEIPSQKKGAPPRTRLDKGKELPIPRAHGNTANKGFARYFADTLARVIPIKVQSEGGKEKFVIEAKDEAKFAASRKTFWQQMGRAASELKGQESGLADLVAFREKLDSDAELVARLQRDAEKVKAAPQDLCTLAWRPHLGETIIEREAVRAWYRDFYARAKAEGQESGPCGVCQVTGLMGPIPTTHAVKLSGVPGGLGTGVSVVSFDKAAFQSYDLDKAENAGIGSDATNGYLLALQGLIDRQAGGRFVVGGVLFLFWTRDKADAGDVCMLDAPSADEVAHLLRSAHKGAESAALDDVNDFFLLGLSGNAARAIVRDYLELPLGRVRENLVRWFEDLRIADASLAGAGQPTCLFPLWMLALGTAMKADQIAPDTPGRLMASALAGMPLPESILSACLGRLRAEGRTGFKAARLALIKMFLKRRGCVVSETLNAAEQRPAYVCGRLMSVFEQIQRAALGKVNAGVVDKYFGTFSAAPAMVMGRLFGGAQHHLKKIAEKKGLHARLSRLLTEVSALLSRPPEGQLNTVDQAWFALGYYHQRARQFEEIAKRKAEKATQSA